MSLAVALQAEGQIVVAADARGLDKYVGQYREVPKLHVVGKSVVAASQLRAWVN